MAQQIPLASFCLFVWTLSSHSRIFHSFGDVTIAGEGLQILTYAWHSWPLSSEGSLTCLLRHGPTLYNGHLRGPVTLAPVAERLAVELSLQVLRLRSAATRDRTPIYRSGERSLASRWPLLMFRSHGQRSRSNCGSLYKWCPLNICWPLR